MSFIGDIIGGAIQADATKDAAYQQAQSARDAIATQKQMYDQTRSDNMPALDARNASLQKMRELLGIGGDSSSAGYGSLSGSINAGDVQNEAGYQFGLNQGMNTLNNQLAAKGMRNSGAALKAAAQYGNDYATTKYDNAFNRAVTNRNQQLNPLQSIAGLGQSGASTIAGAGTNSANAISNNQTAIGNALGASSIASGNALAKGIGSAAGWYGNLYANNQNGLNAFNSYSSNGNTYANWDLSGTNRGSGD